MTPSTCLESESLTANELKTGLTKLQMLLSLTTAIGTLAGAYLWVRFSALTFGVISITDLAVWTLAALSGAAVGMSFGLILGGLIDVVFFGRLDDQEDEAMETSFAPLAEQELAELIAHPTTEQVRKAS
jgi:hypothetical protein